MLRKQLSNCYLIIGGDGSSIVVIVIVVIVAVLVVVVVVIQLVSQALPVDLVWWYRSGTISARNYLSRAECLHLNMSVMLGEAVCNKSNRTKKQSIIIIIISPINCIGHFLLFLMNILWLLLLLPIDHSYTHTHTYKHTLTLTRVSLFFTTPTQHNTACSSNLSKWAIF